ncbi:MAG: DUF1501 domain-containing protein [Pirellulales bacterium]
MIQSQATGRRGFLAQFSSGLAGMALTCLLNRPGGARAATPGDSDDPPPHHPPRVKRVVQIFLQGGLSQVDSFDYKPELIAQHEKPMPASERPDVFFGKVGLLHKPHFEFKQRGQSGLWVSDLFPHLAERADELTVIRSMFSATGNHTPATYLANSGFNVLGFPAAGAWVSYGLGSEADNLPTFVVLADVRGVPTGGANNWTNGFLPGRHQGILLRSSGPAINDLSPAKPIDERVQQARYEFINELNQRHLGQRGQNDALAARIRSYELAARMQLAVPETTDLEQETEATHSLYGLDVTESADFGRNCLLARRLLERGVRFVQLWSGGPFGGPTWDAHDDVPSNHTGESRRIDRPVAGLLADLRQRGMLDDTLVIFNTEFGRTPFAQSDDGKLGAGRDHNQAGFTAWLAGGGLKHGVAYGASDAFGYRAVENPVSVYDFHATILHLLGIDHQRLTYYHNGIRRRLTDVHGHVVSDILA